MLTIPLYLPLHSSYVVPLTPLPRGRILGRNWEKSLRSFPPCNSQVTSTISPPPPGQKCGLCNWFVMQTLYTETSSLKTLKIMPKTSTTLYNVRTFMNSGLIRRDRATCTQISRPSPLLSVYSTEEEKVHSSYQNKCSTISSLKKWNYKKMFKY
jgi:hypothetical protein